MPQAETLWTIEEIARKEEEGHQHVGDVHPVGNDIIAREADLCVVEDDGKHQESTQKVDPKQTGRRGGGRSGRR